jgi:glucose-specific phosphotransferase system IIA component
MALFGKKTNNNEIVVLSPVDGTIKPLNQVNDEVFAGEMVGRGVAVTPKNNVVVSPVDGSLKVAFATGHAYGIATKPGVEILIHIGVDTVTLNGEGFEMKTTQGKSVKATTTTLAEIDLGIIEEKAKSSDIMVLATNDTSAD